MLGSSVSKYWRKLRIKPKLLSSTKLNKMNFNKLYGFLSVKKFESGEEKSVGCGAGEWSPQLSSIKLNQLRRKHSGQDPPATTQLTVSRQSTGIATLSILLRLYWEWDGWQCRPNLSNRLSVLVQHCDCGVHFVVVILIIKQLYTSFSTPLQDRTDTHSQTWHMAQHFTLEILLVEN